MDIDCRQLTLYGFSHLYFFDLPLIYCDNWYVSFAREMLTI